MNIDECSIIPAKSNHAVQAAVFVLEFPAQLAAETIKAAISYYESSDWLRELFPLKEESHGVSIALGPNQAVGIEHGKEPDGLILKRIAADGNIELAFSMQSNLLSYTCNKYTRWNVASSDAISLLAELSKFIFPEPGVAVIGLQYVDGFFVSGKKDNFRPAMVFSDGNDRLPRSMLTQTGPWHSHSGWYEETGDCDKMLNNLNISFIHQEEKSLLQITTAHRDFLAKRVESFDEVEAVMKDRFDKLHRRNKVLFHEILGDDVRKAIGLEVV